MGGGVARGGDECGYLLMEVSVGIVVSPVVPDLTGVCSGRADLVMRFALPGSGISECVFCAVGGAIMFCAVGGAT